jgi:hypothetical protein
MVTRAIRKSTVAATPLNVAWIKFAPRTMRREFFAYVPGDVYGRPLPPDSIGADDRGAVFRMLVDALPQLLEHAGFIEPSVASDMREAVFAKLEAGKLLVFAIPVKPMPSLEPIPLPPSMLRLDYFKWHKSAVEGGGFTFRDVTVIRAERPARRGVKSKPPTSSQGRPRRLDRSDRRREAIVSAFENLPAEIKRKTHTMIADALKRRLTRDEPGLFAQGRGLSYQNICRILQGRPDF